MLEIIISIIVLLLLVGTFMTYTSSLLFIFFISIFTQVIYFKIVDEKKFLRKIHHKVSKSINHKITNKPKFNFY